MVGQNILSKPLDKTDKIKIKIYFKLMTVKEAPQNLFRAD